MWRQAKSRPGSRHAGRMIDTNSFFRALSAPLRRLPRHVVEVDLANTWRRIIYATHCVTNYNSSRTQKGAFMKTPAVHAHSHSFQVPVSSAAPCPIPPFLHPYPLGSGITPLRNMQGNCIRVICAGWAAAPIPSGVTLCKSTRPCPLTPSLGYHPY